MMGDRSQYETLLTDEEVGTETANETVSREVAFFDEEVVKVLDLRDQYENRNRLAITSHRVIIETTRKFGQKSFLLRNTQFIGLFAILLDFLKAIFSSVAEIILLKTDKDTVIRTKDILLKDVININIIDFNYSRLCDAFKLLFYIQVMLWISLCMYYSPIFYIVVVIMIALTILFCIYALVVLVRPWENYENISSRTIILSSTLLSIFIFTIVIIFTSRYVHKTMIHQVICSLTLLISGFLIRFVAGDTKVPKSVLVIESRRGSHIIALNPEQTKEARQIIWKSRVDIKPSQNYE
eukprot:TRINITY_DN3962_c0_g1_i1.p1 TRINITY_DN3962_c0_g1~~TRINITY_DN3962_c0_g1_i1.p1  ORF type:complete len:296 (-),score=43.83 TRINITY_DN3962_c0_g1_i1:34-921(-)